MRDAQQMGFGTNRHSHGQGVYYFALVFFPALHRIAPLQRLPLEAKHARKPVLIGDESSITFSPPFRSYRLRPLS